MTKRDIGLYSLALTIVISSLLLTRLLESLM